MTNVSASFKGHKQKAIVEINNALALIPKNNQPNRLISNGNFNLKVNSPSTNKPVDEAKDLVSNSLGIILRSSFLQPQQKEKIALALKKSLNELTLALKKP